MSTKTGTLKQISCKWDQSFCLSAAVKLSLLTGFVQVLTTSCQKEKEKIQKYNKFGSPKETPDGFRYNRVICDLKEREGGKRPQLTRGTDCCQRNPASCLYVLM